MLSVQSGAVQRTVVGGSFEITQSRRFLFEKLISLGVITTPKTRNTAAIQGGCPVFYYSQLYKRRGDITA